MRAVLVLFVLAACHGSSPPESADAAVIDTAPPPPRGSTRAIVLAFDGVSLTQGPDDATANVSAIITAAVTVPPFRDGTADRMAVIDATVAKLHSFFDAYDTPLITTRPASGTYTMVVFGGLASQVIGGNDAQLGVATNDHGDTQPSNVAFVFDTASSDVLATNSAAFVIGTAVGLDPTSAPPDNCMCAAAGCTIAAGFCTFSEDQLRYLAGTLGTHP